jgi:hypothetical protein
MSCGLKYLPSNMVRKLGDRDNLGWPMTFQHANDITQVEEPSSTSIHKKFRSMISWHTPLLCQKKLGEEDEVYNM